MSTAATIAALLASAERDAGEQERMAERIAARLCWAREAIAALAAAQKRMDAAWDRIFDALPDDLDDEECEEIPPPPEQAELDAILAEIAAVRDHDRWPRHLYWGDV